MIGVRSYIAVLCVMLLAAPAGGFAADPPQSQTGQPGASQPLPLGAPTAERRHLVGKITNPYRPVTAPPNNLANTSAPGFPAARRQSLSLVAGCHCAGAGE